MRAILRGFTGPSPGVFFLGALFVSGCTTIEDYEKPPEEEPTGTGTGTTITQPTCDAYEYNGETFNCDTLDRCTETDIL